MSNKQGHKVYTEEFKKTIVELYNSGKGVTELCKEYGLKSNSMVYKWINNYSPIKTVDKEEYSKDDIVKLKKQLAELQEENTILKKAVAIFSKR